MVRNVEVTFVPLFGLPRERRVVVHSIDGVSDRVIGTGFLSLATAVVVFLGLRGRSLGKLNKRKCLICRGSGKQKCRSCSGSGCIDCRMNGSTICSACQGQG
uniref:Uncharacterized protein n=1 Tax=Compsopogon caeruleus TaxID=31354 RepID=A0A7S1T5I5_9RHOD